MEWEPVIYVADFYDIPRSGVAMFRGEPVFFQEVFDEIADDWSGVYTLSPFDKNLLPLLKERDRIFMRWRAAFDAGNVTLSSYPALPDDKKRWNELEEVLAPHLKGSMSAGIRQRAEYRYRGETRLGEFLWSEAGETAHFERYQVP